MAIEIEQVKPNKPKATFVGYLVIAVLLVFLLGAAVIVTWRAHEANKTPYNKHPTSHLVVPASETSAT